MGLFKSLKEFFLQLFSRDPDLARRRGELRKLCLLLAERHPPYYRRKQNLVLTGFAEALYSFVMLLQPLSEILRATVANSDVRTAQRYFDYLIECRLAPETRERLALLAHDSMVERLKASLDPDHELERMSQEFQAFLRELEALGLGSVDAELAKVERFAELARHDFERILGLFDPAISLDASGRRPDFAPVEGELAVPELVDLYYLLEGFAFDETLKDNLLRLLERRSASGADEAKRKKVGKLFSQLSRLLEEGLEPALILALLRAASEDPDLLPSTPREKRDYFESYRRRLSQRFEKDRERLLRERHEGAVAQDIKALFGSADILELEGYNDELDAYLRRESPNSLSWIKPLRALKTFLATIFETEIKEPVKRILVEGYFDNKIFQNNLANVLYQCERSGGRISEFETQMVGNGRVSVTALRRYVEEMRRGKDIGQFLNRLVDAINGRARDIVADEASLIAMLGEALSDLLADYRRSSPDLMTNIRTLGGGRNKEIIGQLQAARDKVAVLIKIMRNFTVVKAVPFLPEEGEKDRGTPAGAGGPAATATTAGPAGASGPGAPTAGFPDGAVPVEEL